MSSQDLREAIIDWLKIIASFTKQNELQASAPKMNVADEMVEMWFDNYHPETELHKKAFTENETNEMNEFHSFYDQYASNLPSTLNELQKTNEWALINKKAKQVLIANGW